MDKEQARQRIEVLKKEIDTNRYQYHVLDSPRVSDAVDDSLKRELKNLEDQFPDLISPDSPTQRIGGQSLKKFKKIKHLRPMLSLNDIFNLEELKEWVNRLRRLAGEKIIDSSDFYCELKMDGLAISLIYENGILVRGATRGDGIVGEDVTANIRTIESIPLKLRNVNSLSESIEVRGEVYITKEDFDLLNSQRKKEGLSHYANPRNIAAGSIRQLDPNITAKRELKFMLYSIEGIDLDKHEEIHKLGQDLGFDTNLKNNKLCKNIDQIQDYYNYWEEKKGKLPYQIDGIVVGINDLKLFKKLGVVGKAPRGQVAYKFPAEEATSVVKDIHLQVGRTGKLTPVAILEPTIVAGSKISRATLHNFEEIKRKDVRIGDTVIIRKAGDVIPEIVSPIKRMRSGKEVIFKEPTQCPICGGKVKRTVGEVDLYCKDKNCSIRQYRNIIHAISKKGFNIEGLGPRIIDQLLKAGLIEDVSDIFILQKGDLQPLERFAEKSVDNLLSSIQSSKEIELDRFIYSLGIRHVGDQTAVDLAKYFHNLNDFLSATNDEFSNIYGIGEEATKSITEFLSNQKNKNLLKRIIKSGVKVKNYHLPAHSKALAGLNFVVTGSLSEFTRDDIHRRIVQYGGRVSSSVSSKTDYLIAGENPGSKYEKAIKLNLKIISEKEFQELIS